MTSSSEPPPPLRPGQSDQAPGEAPRLLALLFIPTSGIFTQSPSVGTEGPAAQCRHHLLQEAPGRDESRSQHAPLHMMTTHLCLCACLISIVLFHTLSISVHSLNTYTQTITHTTQWLEVSVTPDQSAQCSQSSCCSAEWKTQPHRVLVSLPDPKLRACRSHVISPCSIVGRTVSVIF